ncbi:fatty-acyl-CoA synthase [Mesobacillus persicus]|uniref:Fatty-acyl-CoA synthase n=1 Tax=Mesobacillus persicus TaxID=930146 RepID=A0A1H7WL43_9BACI|nr:long-chain fatty acid--CoA ligase [Mesobacillus persicus]SEM21845.1 fatty-acyl-CoA synthase [Mesobacillus persicus]
MRWELDWLENRTRLSPEAVALIDAEENTTRTFAELNSRSQATANWLYEKGVRKGERIALLSPNHLSYFELLFACGKIGAIFVPINWRLSLEEVHFILTDCSPKLIGYHSKFKEIFDNPLFVNYETFQVERELRPKLNMAIVAEEPLDEKDPLAIIYTGGTTGKPKGVVLSHQSILTNAVNTVISWNLTNDDTTLTYMPLFHTGGLNALSIPILLAGGKVVIASDYDPVKAITYLNHYQCTTVLLVPTMYHMMIETAEFKTSSFPSIKTFLSGGAPCPFEIYEAFKRKGLLFKEGYGLTEAGPNNFYIHPEEAGGKRGSVGKPMLFNTVKLQTEEGQEAGINEVGEILIQGKHSFEYYWNQPQATRETIKDGWIHTGDLAKKDEGGYFYIVGRKKDMIITGGENVYPLEVEHWLASHPQINELAVIGLPDQKWGEIVTACLVTKTNDKLSEEELRRYCSRKLGSYKVPKQFLFLEKLPKTHVGKIDKVALKRLAMATRN